MTDKTETTNLSLPNERPLDMKSSRTTARSNLDLPYGYWQKADGSQILFDRNYVPMLRRDPDGSNARICPPVWVQWIDQQWFWGTGKADWPKRKAKPGSWSRRHGEAILDAFEAGEPIDPFVLDQ